MGYTHYWENDETITSEQWRNICTYAHRLFKAAKENGIPLLYESDEPGTEPDVNEAFIRFNGDDDDGHETFYLSREATSFEFCKTARKPYDYVVGDLLWYVAEVVPGFSTRNDDEINYRTGENYDTGEEGVPRALITEGS